MSQIFNKLIRNQRTTSTLFRSQNVLKRRVSLDCWDAFGHLKDGSDLAKRQSISWWPYANPIQYRIGALLAMFGPTSMLLYNHGVFDYILRRRAIKPLEPDWTAEYPAKPPEGYVNPLFEPARIYAKKLEAKRAAKKAAAAGN
mmetsp:Transcript_65389/g.80048  ORF Transcript_65389/g.80048 Transcript_65389/m.80048 type:complete len:143 (-) Transcript_65389:237-665(-)